jgi:proton-dependent oligopeptide transporter, POT family
VLTGLINPGNLALLIIVADVAAAVSYFVVIISRRHVTDTERSRVIAFIPLFIASIALWSLYQQQFTVLTDDSDQRLDRFIGGFENAGALGAVDQSGVHHRPLRRVRGHLDAARPPPAGHTAEVRSGHHDHGPGLPAVPAVRGGGPNSTPLLALIGIVLGVHLAELLRSPVGLSVTTKLALEAFHTQMVALFSASAPEIPNVVICRRIDIRISTRFSGVMPASASRCRSAAHHFAAISFGSEAT